ncbi:MULTISPECIES: orotidine-5'-phosphate decarboxylase [Bacillus]|jgi:orotidine-5'-phosphate decarboxylase|uniref:Orotidine 5'-phosphate decarboxylase n=1 Tax=Bacillus licheniformis (strain ATCC 14580 / DSM 13 / JCM 2505 / CCUG 7422 / NBRC 12200 / NCIMB 9375 / NCTC 10341 / NRRL NRS-1264 / Gibson 46) TaxID=279010 RepID=PYRF_BACLD|nr:MULTISPECIES: orotidine-5'-phosphate decarboxylase [Bacillus]Q65JU4.1 RecName: Full=Orotidine 5'-phosphate decarboxylase; AltName: Full=OMP decarboxylase; Short=OMPDCase; Short=OMPdecase [Bacillus licheniformis DSM 13 = ATCC 14580]AAU23310.1 orotidine 5'-phosphate decarboxylase [Bacillus licheniformis DSM 13 = ATCC 14580]AAU40670.1 orotidine 5'-phosphate decarboxylase PyrF [Bacillus licheniformis DSM 13 = ATCC 14580]AKQ72917.1 orotidine 5'-phosphate decarboxylase [Bacillus licheniformis WX-0
MNNTPPIIALDFASAQETYAFLDRFQGEELFVKVGMELFYQEGPAILENLQERGCRIFLDLKCHDIPTTVYKAMKRLAGFGVSLVNVHAAGGKQMMESALEGLEAGTPAGQKRPSLIAVTQLTSTSSEMLQRELLIETPLLDTVVHYSRLAEESGLDGVVCSVHEAEHIYRAVSVDFLTVTPGIRMADDKNNDQVRVATPGYAREKGVSAIVVGRSITQAEDPVSAYRRIGHEWEGTKA